MIRRALVVLICSLSMAIAADRPSTDAERADIRSVETYLATSYTFSSALAKQAALSGGVRKVSGWPLLNALHQHRLYSFPTTYATPFAYGLIAVDDGGKITPVDTIEGFNRLLTEERFHASSDAEIVDLARDFLRVHRFNVYMTEKLDLGIRVISSADDIPYPEGLAGEEQRTRVATEFQIQEPRLVAKDQDFRYTIFGWQAAGGSISRYVVVLNRDRIIDLKVDVLAQWIGRHDVGH